jgi:hypothetical protein
MSALHNQTLRRRADLGAKGAAVQLQGVMKK